MIYTSIKYLRIASIYIGFAAILCASFLPFYSSCRWNSDESGTIAFVEYGYERSLYYIVTVMVLIIFFSGYFWHGLVNKILLNLFSIVLLLFMLLVMNLPGWGARPCVNSSEIGLYLLVYGTLSVILGTFISIYREVD